MVATSSRIGFIIEQYRVAVASNPVVDARYGNVARTDDEPVPTFLDNRSDAQTVANQRLGLLGQQRRRFDPQVQDIEAVLDLSRGASVRYIDRQRDADRSMLIAEVEIDFSDQTANLVVWG